jgi:hypothetical protein
VKSRRESVITHAWATPVGLAALARIQVLTREGRVSLATLAHDDDDEDDDVDDDGYGDPTVERNIVLTVDPTVNLAADRTHASALTINIDDATTTLRAP